MATKRRTNKNSKSKQLRKEIDAEIGMVHFKDKLENAMRTYGHYVVEQRAIPDDRDGLKPVHRRILWAAFKLGAFFNGQTFKSARVAGDVVGKYHPHGDAAVYETMVKMVQGSYFPTLHGQGNFGSYSMGAAAPRYTEVKMKKETEALLFDPYYLKVTPTVPTYDGRETEPVILPAQLPLVLATGGSGVAVGVTTKIPAFTVQSLRKITMAMLEGETNTKKLSQMVEMSSPYGGKMISNGKEVHQMFTSTEPVTLVWTCDYRIFNDEKMIITGMHPEWSFASKMDRIKEDPDVAEAANYTSKDGLQIVIKIKRGSDPDKVFDRLMKLCVGNITYRCNVTKRRLDKSGDVPEVKTSFESTSPYVIIQRWLKWRLHLEQLALRQEMLELRQQTLREKLLLLACQSLDVIFSLLKKRGIDKNAELSKKLKISIEDAKTIWAIAVGRLDRLSEEEQKKKLKVLRDRAVQIKKDFANPKRPVLAGLKAMQL